jgi:hypothetical protein
MIRKMLPVLILAITITACQKAPDMSVLSNDLMVYTHYDNACDFSQYNTFYIPDSILILDNRSEGPSYYTKQDHRAENILKAYKDEMKARGYIETNKKAEADLGLQITYIKNTNTYVTYDYPWWWYDFYDYWPCGYWDPFYYDWYPFYPYPVTYSYTVNTLTAEIVDLKNANASSKHLPFVWTSYIAGMETSNQINISRALAGVYQSFDQSPYIGKNNSK